MALTWDVKKIKNSGVVTTDPNDPNKWHPVTETLVWYCLFVGMPAITEKNRDEFYTRVRVWESVNGPQLQSMGENGPEPKPITLDNVIEHVGLETNVTRKSLSTFWAGIKGEVIRAA